jgi:osmotically-inducible protein OsmY
LIQNDLTTEPQERRGGEEIKVDIQQRLRSDVWLSGQALNVQVANGIARLGGTVGSVLEKERATTLAYVLGITRVDADGLRVEWSSRARMRRSAYADRTDDELARTVQDAFLQDPHVRPVNPTVQVRAGAVTLRGYVGSLTAKRAAEENARHTIGVRTVNNRLQVRPPSDAPDEAVADRVRIQLHDNPVVDRYDITVSVRYGVVTLNGIVDNPIEQQTAEDVAGRVGGVVDVANRREVKVPQLGRSDEELRSSITDQLWWSPFVDENRVRVDVDHGVATLTGTVETWWEKKLAEENARESGPRVVKNHLQIAGE